MRLMIKHTTRYRFKKPLRFALQQIRMTPRTNAAQSIVSWETRATGGTKELVFLDHHRNVTELIACGKGTTELEIVSEGEVELKDMSGIVGRHMGPAPLWLYRRETPLTEAKTGVKALVRGLDAAAGSEGLERLHALSTAIRDKVDYVTGVSQSDWTVETVIEAGQGVCQDHTHVFLSAAREMGFPARYVSGYLMLNDRTAQEAMHAWAEAHIDGLGWVGFDVSNGISPDTRYVRVATGLDYSEAAPVSGMRVGGSGERLDVSLDVVQQ
jgi:transglutaminase-like putative cysteine protease